MVDGAGAFSRYRWGHRPVVRKRVDGAAQARSPAALPPASLWPWLWALGTTTVISLLVGLRPYRLLLATQPLRVLRNDVVANVWPLKFYLPIVSVVVVLLLAGLMGGSMLLWAVLAGAVVLALLCGVLGWMLLNVLRRMTLKSLPLRLAVSRLLRQLWSTLSQLSAFSLSFMLLALLLVFCVAICSTAGSSSYRQKARTTF